tara:strand:- start:398 stop:610 length:213 start_codon:yes stop_codon:yes gene_type:complete
MSKPVMKDANGNVLSEREAKIFMNFQERFNRVKKMVESNDKKLTNKDRKFYNEYKGSIWETDPLFFKEDK